MLDTAQSLTAPPGSGGSRLHDLAERVRPILRYDLPASLVVFLVALPLSLGIAVASDAPVLAGLIAAVIGGVIAGALGGTVSRRHKPVVGRVSWDQAFGSPPTRSKGMTTSSRMALIVWSSIGAPFNK